MKSEPKEVGRNTDSSKGHTEEEESYCGFYIFGIIWTGTDQSPLFVR
jgi:hypothetical protein